MGDEWDGRSVSGISLAAAIGNAPVAPPLTVSLYWNGPTPLRVSGSSGVAGPTPSPWSPNVVVLIISGGVAPYEGSLALENNPSNKLFFANAPDGAHTTIAWRDFAINEAQTTDMVYVCSDSAGASVTERYDGVVIQRTS